MVDFDFSTEVIKSFHRNIDLTSFCNRFSRWHWWVCFNQGYINIIRSHLTSVRSFAILIQYLRDSFWLWFSRPFPMLREGRATELTSDSRHFLDAMAKLWSTESASPTGANSLDDWPSLPEPETNPDAESPRNWWNPKWTGAWPVQQVAQNLRIPSLNEQPKPNGKSNYNWSRRDQPN
jgi:hypothetical protein